MTILLRSDQGVALDFGPPHGPFIVLTRDQFRELVAEIKRQGGLL